MNTAEIQEKIEKTNSLEKIARTIAISKNRKAHIVFKSGEKETVRLFVSSHGTICHYGYRRKRYGYPLHFDSIESITPVSSKGQKSDEQKWIDAWNKVIARLEKSGLWEDIIEDIKVALSIGHKRMKEAYNDYWDISYQNDERPAQEAEFLNKYPELKYVNEDGNPYINTSVLWPYHCMPRVKKMRFNRYDNEAVLKRIQNAMDQKVKLHLDDRYSYDISFEYNPEKNRAWYSEEYRGCGNGHYYIALDSTHALFREDD